MLGGEDGGALVGRQAPGLSAAGGSVGGCGAAEALEGLVGERPVGRLLAGVAGGTADGGDGHGSGGRRPAGRAKMPDVGGEARVVERPSLEPGDERAERRRVAQALTNDYERFEALVGKRERSSG